MKFLKLLLLALVLLGVGGFIMIGLTPVNIEQTPTTKTLNTEDFLKNDR